MSPARVAILLATIGLAAAGCKSDGNGGNSPTSPSNSSRINGIWAGTLTRPGGAAPLALRWDVGIVTGSVDELRGTITLTGPGGTATASAKGVPAGNDNNGYTIHMSFSEASPASACRVIGNTNSPTGDPFAQPYSTINAPSFSIAYTGDCQGLLNNSSPQAFVQETAQLSLIKQ